MIGDRIDVFAELRTMRKRFVNCAMHNGSDREFAEGACESFDAAVNALYALTEEVGLVADRLDNYAHAGLTIRLAAIAEAIPEMRDQLLSAVASVDAP